MWIFGDQIAKYLVMGSIFEQYASYLEQNEIAGAYTFALYMIILGVLMFGNYKQIVNADGGIMCLSVRFQLPSCLLL